MSIFLLFVALLFTACSEAPPPPKNYTLIQGRDSTPLYRAIVPLAWRIEETTGDLNDTTKPLITFHIDDEVRITIHNFEGRIPAEAQVARWQTQVKEEGLVKIEKWGGFSGLFLETPTILAWSMNLAPRHSSEKQKTDFTIKATGNSLEKHRAAIITFAHTFELIEAL